MNIRILSVLLSMTFSSLGYASPVQFEDKSDKLGFTRGTETWGIAWGNLNGDKWPDIWNSGHRDFPRMYRNTGDGDFDDVTMIYDVNMNGYWIGNTQFDVHGGAWGDYDNDGDDDIIVGDENELFINNTDSGGYFTKSSLLTAQNYSAWNNTDSDRALESDVSCNGQYILLFDLDANGDLEEICGDEGTFPKSVTGASSSLIPAIGLSNDAALGDFNNDLRTDIVVTRGALRPAGASKINDNRIEAWFRAGTGTSFTFSAPGEVKFLVDGKYGGAFDLEQEFVLNTNGPNTADSDRGVSIRYSSQTGLWTVSDTDNRAAYVRVIAENTVSDPVMNGLQTADEPQATMYGVNTASGIEWVSGIGLSGLKSCVSVVAADFDNDMDLDLYMACRDGVENLANRYFDNQGDGTFVEVQSHGAEGPIGAGIQFGLSDSVITADYDVDGFMDLAVSNGLLFWPYSFGGPDTLIRNKGNGNHWIQMDLVGTTSPRAAIGAKVYVTAGGVIQLREQSGGYHRWSQNHTRIHFGLAANTTVDQVRIEWPSGQVDTFNNVTADTLYTATEGGSLNVVGAGTPVHVTFQPGDECGQPVYTPTLGPAMLIWRECGTDNWRMRAKGGLGRLTEGRVQMAVGQIVGDSNFGYVNPISAGAGDIVDNSVAAIIDFSIGVQQDIGNSKGINFSTAGQSRTCFTLEGNDFEQVYLGNTGKRINVPFDLTTLGPCVLDFDGDGLTDDVDLDDDNDGVPDINDAFPYNPNESVDSDGDGVGDNADVFPNDPTESVDSDNDGVGDNADAFPNNPNETADSDGDGVGDNADAFPNDATETTDTDGDGIGDNSDIDADNDGITNAAEFVAGQPSDQLLDDFETNQGWATNPFNTDTATTGQWEVANPEATSSSGYAMQLNNTTSGSNALVTQAAAGSGAGTYDIDNGVTSALSPSINLPAGVTTLKFNYYFAHRSNASSADFFRVSIRSGTNQQTILSQLGNGTNRAASWTAFSVDVSSYAGQTIRLLVEAADAGSGSLVEAAVDDISISVTTLSSNDADGDGVVNENDLDSDNDTIPDVVEAGLIDADGNYLVDDLINDQGSVTTPPDSDGDGIPDFLDVESNNAANDGTAYDIDTTVNAALDTNGDGMIGSADSNGGVDADSDGIDDSVDTNPNQPGGGPAPTDSDGDGVPDTEDAYPNDVTRTVPSVSVADVTVLENAGNALLSVDLSTLPRKPASIVISTTDDSALSGSDYTAVNMTLTYAIGETSKSVLIPIIEDATPEATESFTVDLSGPSNLTLATSTATVTIQDNDSSTVTDACFEPVYDRSTEKGVFIWKLCDGSGEWRMRVTGGGDNNGVFYDGYIESVGGLTYTEYSFEPNDVIDNTNPDILSYAMKVWGGGEDGLNFVPAADACLTTTAPNVPIYLGQNRIMVDSPFNLTTLAACDVVPPSAECGEPAYDLATEQGIFLWKDCVTGQWEVRLSGGGDPGGVFAGGKVTSDTGFTNLTTVSLEGGDIVDNVTNINEIIYELRVWNAAQDGFGFTPSAANACFIQDSTLPVYLGEGKQLVTAPLNLDTLASCNIAPEPAECGQPVYDNATDPGLYLWKDCSAAGPDAQWLLRVVGGGLSWSPYSGYLTSTNPVTATGVLLEPSGDTIDATLGDNGLDYILSVANKGVDGIDITIPANSTTCFDLEVMPVGAQMYVGRDKLLKTTAFNLEDLGACQ